MSNNNSSDQNAGFLGKKLLIVDDEYTIVSLFQTILQLVFSGVEIDIAENGLQAVESFRSKQHGILLMDLNMPVMDGFTAYNEIHQLCDSNNWDMPSVIFCTGFAPPDKMQKVLAENPKTEFLPKPISPDDLIGAVQSRLEQYRI